MTDREPDRREFLKEVSAGAVALSLSQGAWAGEGTVKRPNILFVLVDQLRMECLGAYGNRDMKTPHIDSLAGDGVRFVNSTCPFPVCTPSRYSILSGMYVHEHRGWDNHCTLASSIDTFPKLLKAAGYRTKAIGKMHMTPTYLDVGFEELLLSEQNGPGRWDDDYHRYLMERDLFDHNDLEDQEHNYRAKARKEYWETFGALVSNLPEEHHSTTWVGDRTIEALADWSPEGGNLLMASFIKPHHPFDPPAPWNEMYDPETLTLLPGWVVQCYEHDLKVTRGYFPNDDLTEPALRRVMAYYYGAISHIDHQVGRMIESLKQRGLYEDTLIVFTADHGEYLGQHHLLLKANLMYESLLKVPLIVKWPGNTQSGSLSDRLVCNIDLAPTLCRAAGCAPAASMSGEDLSAPTGRELLFAEARAGKHLAARSKNRKLLLLEEPTKDLDLKLFYDLEKDPGELKNLYNDPHYQAEAKAMEQTLLTWGEEGSQEVYLNEAEPQIAGPNVPPDFSHRDKAIEYFKRKMA